MNPSADEIMIFIVPTYVVVLELWVRCPPPYDIVKLMIRQDEKRASTRMVILQPEDRYLRFAPKKTDADTCVHRAFRHWRLVAASGLTSDD